jgi:hypothetical protein
MSLLGCGAAGDERPESLPDGSASPTAGSSSPLVDAGAGEAQDAATLQYRVDPRCIAPEGIATSPRNVADVVTLLNALPRPLTLACVIDALARPLSLQAVDSVFSAQPAQGRRSPRVFLFFPGLTLSVVPEGPGAPLLELAEARPGDQSLKAELEFPIAEQLDEASPYHRVHYNDTLTTCGFCHQGETRDETIASPLAFVSPALRPRDYQRVSLAELRSEAVRCDVAVEPERCALLHALFGPEPAPIEHDFPTSYKTFF